MKKLQQMLDEALKDIGASLGKPDWTYKDLPRMTPQCFKDFVDIVGEENLYFITFADYGATKRGQVLISPAGMDRIAAER